MSRHNPDKGALAKLITGFAYKHSSWQVFQDFIEFGAIAISNAVDLSQFEEREARYLQMAKKYSADELKAFAQMIVTLAMSLDRVPVRDVLGELFMELEFGSKWAGQFFTPQDIADLMGAVAFDGTMKALIEKQGFIRIQEPAAGAGAMVLGALNALRAAGANYQKQLHVTAVDVDIKAVHMTYLQLALLYVPATIVHGNTLTLDQWSVWYTPAHILGGWGAKLSGENAGVSALRKIAAASRAPARLTEEAMA